MKAEPAVVACVLPFEQREADGQRIQPFVIGNN